MRELLPGTACPPEQHRSDPEYTAKSRPWPPPGCGPHTKQDKKNLGATPPPTTLSSSLLTSHPTPTPSSSPSRADTKKRRSQGLSICVCSNSILEKLPHLHRNLWAFALFQREEIRYVYKYEVKYVPFKLSNKHSKIQSGIRGFPGYL